MSPEAVLETFSYIIYCVFELCYWYGNDGPPLWMDCNKTLYIHGPQRINCNNFDVF